MSTKTYQRPIKEQSSLLFVVDRWSLYRGGPCVQVVLVHRWSLYTGGPCTQVVLAHRWSLYTGGPCIQVVLVYRWSLWRFSLYYEYWGILSAKVSINRGPCKWYCQISSVRVCDHACTEDHARSDAGDAVESTCHCPVHSETPPNPDP